MMPRVFIIVSSLVWAVLLFSNSVAAHDVAPTNVADTTATFPHVRPDDMICRVCTKAAHFLVQHASLEDCHLHCSEDSLHAIGGKTYISEASNVVAGNCPLLCHLMYEDYGGPSSSYHHQHGPNTGGTVISEKNVCPAVGFC